MGFFSPGYGNRMDRQEKAGGGSKASGKSTPAPKPSFDNWEGRRKNGLAKMKEVKPGVKAAGPTNEADAVLAGLSSKRA